MTNKSTKLQLPYIMAAQAQKHITHNEAIQTLDTIVHLSVLDKDISTPGSVSINGDCFIVADNAAGLWAGKENHIAVYQNNIWDFYIPRKGWTSYVADEGLLYLYDGDNWDVLKLNDIGSDTTLLNASPMGAETRFEILEETIALSGAFTDSNISIPDRAIVFSVSIRTTVAVTGASSYECGIIGELSKYGGALDISEGSVNSGVTGPVAYYSDTKIRISPNGGNFTGGEVRIAIHYMVCSPPQQ